MATFDYNKR